MTEQSHQTHQTQLCIKWVANYPKWPGSESLLV